MARIKIEDLPVLEELGKEQLKGIFGGFDLYWGEVVLNPFRWVDTGLWNEADRGDASRTSHGAGSAGSGGQQFRQQGG